MAVNQVTNDQAQNSVAWTVNNRNQTRERVETKQNTRDIGPDGVKVTITAQDKKSPADSADKTQQQAVRDVRAQRAIQAYRTASAAGQNESGNFPGKSTVQETLGKITGK